MTSPTPTPTPGPADDAPVSSIAESGSAAESSSAVVVSTPATTPPAGPLAPDALFTVSFMLASALFRSMSSRMSM